MPERRTPFVRNTTLLLREQHPGPAWPAVAAWSGLIALMAVWVGLMAVTALRVRTAPEAGPDRGRTGPHHRLVADPSAAPAERSMAPHAR